MKNKRKVFFGIFVFLFLLIAFLLGIATGLAKEAWAPQEASERIVPLTHGRELVIREFEWLSKVSVEFSLREKGEERLLGKEIVPQEGYFPFHLGHYEVKQDGETVTVRWCGRSTASALPDQWNSSSFSLNK